MADDFKLPSNCTLPPVFDRIATKPDPYIVCGNDGAGKGGATPEPAKIREDNAKDNFCADASNPITVDFTILTQMQKKALVRAITDAMVEHAGAKPTNLHVIIQEVPKENWALAGVMGDERKD